LGTGFLFDIVDHFLPTTANIIPANVNRPFASADFNSRCHFSASSRASTPSSCAAARNCSMFIIFEARAKSCRTSGSGWMVMSGNPQHKEEF